ncbi:succinate-acetate transporter protein [Peribacillus deserti]|uniref:Succinate-acetate transporter protein n=1 Tax=Peribacillus deserti TaxID=673318 RepID=A0ABS2QJA9_9BACI|nr:YtpI family protein [Peribacillus deserti]MBM7692879.1 succinate-acetate transporter protein [Peribacillus deserti]
MPVLVVLIVITFSFYLYFKIKYVRTQKPAEKKWTATKSSMALGLFVVLFGINQLFLYTGTVTYIVAGVFILLGVINVWAGYKSYKHYLPYVIKEAEEGYKN